jgi:hypothetical protein
MILKQQCNITGSLLGHRPTKTQTKDLKDDDLFHRMMKAWHKLEGTTQLRYQIRKLNNDDEQILATMKWDAVKEEEHGIGFEFEDQWYDLTDTSTSECYHKILSTKQQRDPKYKITKRDEQIITINKTMTEIRKDLSARERDYWWRVAHQRISIMQRESKYRRNEDGSMISNLCPACKLHKETREHYSFDCPTIQTLIPALEAVFDEFKEEHEKWIAPRDNEWNLNEKCTMSTTMMILIAKARWLHHKERCKMAFKQRKTINNDIIIDRTRAAMKTWKTMKDKQSKQQQKETTETT